MFGPFLAYFSLFGVKNIFFKKYGLVMHNNTRAPNTMLSSRKKMKEPISIKLLDRRTDRPYSQDPSGQYQESNKRINQSRDIALENKNKMQYNSAYHTLLT